MEEVIYRDNAIAIIEKNDGFYIQSFKKGTSLDSFNSLMLQFPNIKITNYLPVKSALNSAPYGPELFAVGKERVLVIISGNNLEAKITLNIPSAELSPDNRKNLIIEVTEALKRAGVNYGIKLDALRENLTAYEPFVIAQGIPPVNGKDATVKLYQIQEPKPELVDNGNVNHYNLNLIHQIQAGSWLGERIDPVPGIPGKSVLGTEIPPLNGSFLSLPYDRDSVELVREEGKDVIYALKTGAVHYVGDSIAVYDVMDIKGDVDFNTGNINFNGYVTVKGSVEENFSIHSKKDIEITGEYGIGGVDTIESTEGNIYIRGGVAGKNRAKIVCGKNLYVKYLSDVDVICNGSIYIGFYARNANIRAKQVIVDSPRGQIVGGMVDADIRIECADIGNWMENKTNIIIRGFNRSSLQSRVNEIVDILSKKKEQLVKLKLMITKSDNEDARNKNEATIQKTRQAIRIVQDEIRSLEGERLSIMNFMRTPGEGAVVVKRRIYPRVKLVIQNVSMETAEEAIGSTYIVKDGIIQAL